LFKQTADPYRRFRNVLRILLANLHDYDPDKHTSAEPTVLDRWLLERLNKVTVECVAAYEKFEFRKVFNVLNQFCTNDVSAVYVDLTKDRMYCDSADSERRRSAQATMRSVFEALCKLLAPVLAYTTDEAWEHYGNEPGDIHLLKFPDPDPAFAGSEATEKIEHLLKIRGVIQQEIESARQSKLIGSNNEAAVVLTLPADMHAPELILGDWDAVQEFYMVSTLVVQNGDELAASVTRTEHAKCERCWRHLPTVGKVSDCADLCERCANALSS